MIGLPAERHICLVTSKAFIFFVIAISALGDTKADDALIERAWQAVERVQAEARSQPNAKSILDNIDTLETLLESNRRRLPWARSESIFMPAIIRQDIEKQVIAMEAEKGKLKHAVRLNSWKLLNDDEKDTVRRALPTYADVASGDLDQRIDEVTVKLLGARLLKDRSTSATLLLERAKLYSKVWEYKKAIADCSAALRAGTLQHRAFYERGLAHEALKNYKEAINDYQRASQQFDSKEQYESKSAQSARIALGTIYLNSNRPRQAIGLCNKVLEIDENNVFAYNRRALAHTVLKQFDKAVSDHTRAIELEPEIVTHIENRGDLYYQQGKLDLALADYSKMIEIDPDSTAALKSRAYVLMETKRLDESLADYSRLVRLAPNDPDVYERRAELLTRMGNNVGAQQDTNRARELRDQLAR